MLSNETTLILGAGSSLTFGLPLGADLKNQIADAIDIYMSDFGRNLTRGDYEIVKAFRVIAKAGDGDGSNINRYLSAASEIADALPVCASIDDYIERHAGNSLYEVCAKIGIAHCILNAERKSKLHCDPNRNDPPDLRTLSGSWIDQFLQLTTRGCRADDLPSAFSKLHVINFNYDRCFEYFAFFWLKRVYKLSDNVTQEVLSEINIVHPYGSLGALPCLSNEQTVPFGYSPSATELVQIASRIRTYSESSKDIVRSTAIDKAVQNCRKFVVLGFAFHSQNMDLLTCQPTAKAFARHVYASAVGVPEPRWDVIRGRLRRSFGISDNNLFTHKVSESCEDLFYEFGDNIVN